MRRNWIKIGTAIMLGLAALLAVNEWLLYKAGHLKTIVSDETLWAMERAKVDHLTNNDIVLLGASRMQVNIDIAVLKQQCRCEVIQLALSGMGSSFPVFRDIVKHSSFSGTILIDETQTTLADTTTDQQQFVSFYHKGISLDRKINSLVGQWMHQHFLFLNPNSSSERLWGNLLGKRKFPPPMFTMTYPNREQTSFFQITDTRWIYDLRIEGIRKSVKSTPIPFTEWIEKTKGWDSFMKEFSKKGGNPVFVHMPFSEERWLLENQWMPRDEYWDLAMNAFNVPSVHFADYPELQGFKIPDTSHLDAESKAKFTEQLYKIILKQRDETKK